jgi:hypothetical protein
VVVVDPIQFGVIEQIHLDQSPVKWRHRQWLETEHFFATACHFAHFGDDQQILAAHAVGAVLVVTRFVAQHHSRA